MIEILLKFLSIFKFGQDFYFRWFKTIPDSYNTEYSHSGLHGLLPPFYYVLSLGCESKLTSSFTDQTGIPIEFPMSAWKETTQDPRSNVYDVRKEDDLFQQWIHMPGVYLILGEPGAGKTTLLEQWRDRSKKK